MLREIQSLSKIHDIYNVDHSVEGEWLELSGHESQGLWSVDPRTFSFGWVTLEGCERWECVSANFMEFTKLPMAEGSADIFYYEIVLPVDNLKDCRFSRIYVRDSQREVVTTMDVQVNTSLSTLEEAITRKDLCTVADVIAGVLAVTWKNSFWNKSHI